MWNSVRQECPHLETLTMTGADSPLSHRAGEELVLGNWPRLKVLAAGAVPRHNPLSMNSPQSFLRFLERMPNLEELELSGKIHEPPASFSALARGSLPELRHFRGRHELYLRCTHLLMFTGSIFQAATLRCRASLRSLHLSQPLKLNEGIVGGIIQVLIRFPKLSNLQLSLTCDRNQGTAELLSKLFVPCPQLLKLNLIITSSPVAASVSLSVVSIGSHD